MYAANIFNAKDEIYLPNIYGAITTGSNWRFLNIHITMRLLTWMNIQLKISIKLLEFWQK
ncbi:hypothetical protein TI05_17755 [Achromatium sp. WMS3]|nr:hypothetical protein TI05_17755 [Achromatium sp. WMS3]